MLAASHGDVVALRALSGKVDEKEALYQATLDKTSASLKWFIEEGNIDKDVLDKRKKSLLQYTAGANNVVATQYLLSIKAAHTRNKTGKTALLVAVVNKAHAVIPLLTCN